MLKKLARGLLFGVVCLSTLVALFYAIENWRGKHAWTNYQREREAKGDRFEWSAITPPPVADEQNMAAAPVFAELFPRLPEHYRLKALSLPNCSEAGGNWRAGKIENLGAWRTCFTNENLLAALNRYEPVLREVKEAAARPKCRFPIRYEDHIAALLPHIRAIRDIARVYRLKALAELADGQSDAALADVQMCLRLADCIRDEPTLISFLVRVATHELAMQPVWEGLAAHGWNDGQLAALQAGFGEQRLLDHVALAYQGERMMAYSVTQMLLNDPKQMLAVLKDQSITSSSGQLTIERLIVSLIPKGWVYQNELRIDRWYTEHMIPTVDLQNQRVDARAVMALPALRKMRPLPYNVLLRLLVPAVSSVARKAALAQTTADQVAVACAIERYRLAQGQVPDKLDALVPQYLGKLPHDVIDGQPLRYKRSGIDQFQLYSVGWNGTDDGGETVLQGSGRNPRLDESKGDWVWPSRAQ